MKKFTSFLISLFFGVVTTQAQQIQNAGFENWEDAGTVQQEPVDWSSIKTSDNLTLNPLAPVVWAKSTDAHSGNFSVQLTNVATFGIVANGIVTNGRVHSEFIAANAYVFTDSTDEKWNTRLAARPVKFALWAKYTPKGIDTAQIKILLHKGAGSLPPKPENLANWIGVAQINIYGTVNMWTRYEVPITYLSPENPAFVLIVASSGASATPVEGSVALLDDFELVYSSAGINTVAAEKNLIYSSGNTIFLDKIPEAIRRNARIEIISLNGSRVYSAPANSLLFELDNSRYAKGLYIVHVYGSEANYSQKIYLK